MESKYLIHFAFPAWSFLPALRIGILVLWRESNIVQLCTASLVKYQSNIAVISNTFPNNC